MYYIHFDALIDRGISSNTITDGCKKFRKGTSKRWENKKCSVDGRKVLINIDSIPEATRTKYNIPTGIEYFKNQQEQELIKKQEALEAQKELAANTEKLALYNAYQNDWVNYYSIYKERYKDNKRCNDLARLSAKEHAFWLSMIDVTGNIHRGIFGKAEIVFEYYLDLKKELVFSHSIKNINYFRRKLKELRFELKKGSSIVEIIANKKSDKRPETSKINDFHKGLILFFVGHEKKYSYRLCVDLVNHHCVEEKQPTLSESYIKKIMTEDNEFRTLVYSLRNGTKYLNENILPHASRHPVEFPANLWMIDGTPVQFFCKDSKGRIIRLSLFVILDAFSRKIVGFDIALNEDKFMVMNALKMAVKDEGHLPKEILSDNFSANKTEEIKAIKEQMEKMGTNWRLAKVGNPQDKTQVERFFGVFQSEECALYDDYIGEGITSKRDNRPNTEFLSNATKKLLTVNEMKSRLITMVAKYNEREKRDRKSPLELYKLPKPKAVEMDVFKTALMFWTRTKHTIKQGMVKITVSKIEHSFEIYNHKLKAELQNQTVYVRYDAQNLDTVMLFTVKGEDAICECKKSIKFHIATDDRDEENNQNIVNHTAKVKSYKKHLTKEVQSKYDKALGVIGKDQLNPIHPLDLGKNKINEQESKDIMEVHFNDFGIHKDIKEPKHKVFAPVIRSGIEENTTYESKVVNKKSSVKSSLKVVKTNDN